MQPPVYPGAIQRPYRMTETWTDDMQAAETAARLDNLEPDDDELAVVRFHEGSPIGGC